MQKRTKGAEAGHPKQGGMPNDRDSMATYICSTGLSSADGSSSSASPCSDLRGGFGTMLLTAALDFPCEVLTAELPEELVRSVTVGLLALPAASASGATASKTVSSLWPGL